MADIYYSDKGLNSVISSMPGVNAVIRAETTARATVAAAELASHRRTGNHKVTASFGSTDGFFNLEGDAPMSLEFGHVNKPRGGGYVPGVYIISRAAGLRP